jgi:arylsulfatase A-like enzyme
MEQAPSRGGGGAAAGASTRPSPPVPALGWIALGLLLAAISMRALFLLHDLGLLGPDTLPLVLATRSGGFLHSLGTPLFGDLLPAPYYRPVLHASIALDHALYGLEAFGYHASSVAVSALSGLALFALARALGISAAGGLVAVAFLLLHPVQGVVLPVPARRADGLCLLFTLLALTAQLRATTSERRWPWAPALLSALAIGAKETGFAAPLLCAVAACCAPGLRGAAARMRALRAALPPLLGVVVLGAALRWLVLGDLLGGRPVRTRGMLGALPDMAARVMGGSLSARAVWPDASLPVAALLLAAFASWVAFSRIGRARRQRLAARAAPPLAIVAAALLVFSAGYALGVLLQPWYLLLPVAFVALGLGAWVQSLSDAAASGTGTTRAVAVLGLLGIAACVLASSSDSYLVRGVGDWERADLRATRYLDGLREKLASAPDGERIAYASPPAFAKPVGSQAMRGVVVLAPYTVQAWATLAFPERRIRVVEGGDPAAAAPGEVVVVLGGTAGGGTAGGGAPRAAARDGAEADSARRPSFVVILADDLGYADLGFQGSLEIATPRLDRLARESVRFTDAYVTSPLCAPTRAALLTGRDPNRYGYTAATGTFQHQMRNDIGVSLDETLLPELLRRADYATAAVGKWHLGVRPEYRPLRRGFQSFFGFLAGTHDYFDWGPGLYGPVFRGARRAKGDEYLTDAFAREASEFVRRNAGRPYFLYVAFHAVHGPLEAPQRQLARYAGLEPEQRRAIAAMTTALDEGIGRILDAIEASGDSRDTLVWFLNDNGGIPPISSNAPLRGGKGDLFEGGIRVPSLLRWPRALPAGVYEAPVSVLDVFPTLAAAAGASPPARPLDGVDLLPHLRGASESPPHESLRWRFDRERAIRRGGWKLVDGAEGTLLFDLPADPGESRDLSAEQPGRVASLREELDAWTRELGPARPAWAPASQVPERP